MAAIVADDRQGDLRALVHALAVPMAEDLASPLGRAHLRLIAQLSHPALAYEASFRVIDAPAGRAAACSTCWSPGAPPSPAPTP